MELQAHQHNISTQPLVDHKVFNNWKVVSKGWYIVCPSNSIKKNQVSSFNINGQKIAVFRDEDGKLHTLDAFCAHMGVDLGIGKVVGKHLQCFFHHWEYNSSGKCVHIPAQKEIPEKAKLNHYSTCEAYEHIWVFPDEDSNETSPLEIPSLAGKEVSILKDEIYERKCHYHITMINGIDPQHLKTVHDIHIDMDLKIESSSKREIEIELKGTNPTTNLKEKIWKFFLGPQYAYSMKYADGCVAALTAMKDVKLFGKYKILPELHMIFAYKSNGHGRTIVTPFYVTEKRRGPLGLLKSKFLLYLTKVLFKALQGEDGEVYENIRFKTDCLLPIDAPVGKYIRYINGLEPSVWSKS